MESTDITRARIINQLLRIGHGDLSIYNAPGLAAVRTDPEFFAHIVAWNGKKGEVRDTKIAFPVISLRGTPDSVLRENAAAHLCLLDPRSLLRAARYHKSLTEAGAPVAAAGGRAVKDAVHRYLRAREAAPAWWNRTVLQHRKSVKGLYAMFHVLPSDHAQAILFEGKRPPGTVFAAIADLCHMAPEEAAGTILNYNIPFTVATGALGGAASHPDVILALMERMSGNELIANAKALEKAGVMSVPHLRASFDAAVERAKKDKRTSTLKAGRAKTAVGEGDKSSRTVGAKLSQIQDARLADKGGIEGDWLVLGDRSGSMQPALELAKHVSALIASQVKGKVYLIFFAESPTRFDVTGMGLDEIQALTSRIRAGGATSIGCGLEMLRFLALPVHGIAICSDGGENRMPIFAEAYQKYVATVGVEPTVYLFHVPGDTNVLSPNCSYGKVNLEEFELGADVDYYSLPALISTLRSNRYSLAAEILDTPLLTLDDVFKEATAA